MKDRFFGTDEALLNDSRNGLRARPLGRSAGPELCPAPLHDLPVEIRV